MSAEYQILPDLAGFAELAKTRRVISVYTKLLADELTPIALYRLLTDQGEDSFLFESVEQGKWSRWSFIGVHSAAKLVGRAHQAHWEFNGPVIAGLPTGERPGVELANESLALLASPPQAELPPFVAGLVGYLGYDMVRELEDLPNPPADDRDLPDILLLLASQLAVLDHQTGELYLIANAINFDDSPSNMAQAWQRACDQVHQMVAKLNQPLQINPLAEPGSQQAVEPVRSFSSAEFQALVSQAQEFIKAGDIFQIVTSQCFEVATEASPLDVAMVCFPAGTLSGAPKIRAMELIDQFEKTRRGPYGGVVGYFDFAGNSDAAIGIRTAIVADGKAWVQAGAGIVADSVPSLEDKECQNKAAAVLTAINRANQHEARNE